MRLLQLTLAAVLYPVFAHAHVGHLDGLAGHDHSIAGAAIGTAIALGLWAAEKGRGRNDTQSDPDGDETGAFVEEEKA